MDGRANNRPIKRSTGNTGKRGYRKHHPEAVRKLLCSTMTYAEIAKLLGTTERSITQMAHVVLRDHGFYRRWQIIAMEYEKLKKECGK